MTNYEAGLAAGRAEGVEAIRKLNARLADATADRDEWKHQHENLLAMYQAQTAELAKLKQPRLETLPSLVCSACGADRSREIGCNGGRIDCPIKGTAGNRGVTHE